MTDLVASVLYSADVLMRGRRRESRELFRLDIPVEIKELKRAELAPAFKLTLPQEKPFFIQCDGDGRLWEPYVPAARRENSHSMDRPGSKAERQAQTLDEMRLQLGGAGGGIDDPLIRRRMSQHSPAELREGGPVEAHEGHYVRAASSYPLEDADIKQVKWDDRADTEARLRRAADDIRLVNGRVWVSACEPFLELDSSRYSGRSVEIRFDHQLPHHRNNYNHLAIRHFRLDRLHDLQAWAKSHNGKGVASGYGKSSSEEIELSGAFEILQAKAIKRDDARLVFESRVWRAVHFVGTIIESLPSEAVDSYIVLKRFHARPSESSVATPELYRHLALLLQSAALATMPDDKCFTNRNHLKAAAGAMLGRWQAIDAKTHGVGVPAEQGDEPAGLVMA